jgi:hypothetical protein
MGVFRVVTGSPRAWTRWAFATAILGASAVACGLAGVLGNGALHGVVIATAIATAVAWPVVATGVYRVAARRATAGLMCVCLALPVFVVATNAGSGRSMLADAAAAVAILLAWSLTAAVWPAAGPWVATGSILLACIPTGGVSDAMVAVASAPRALARGVWPAAAHVGFVMTLAAVGVFLRRLRFRLTSN